jgi:hypothetical protein
MRPSETPSPQAVLRSYHITAEDQATLQRLGKDLSDITGRTVSQGAILRALIRHAGRQPYAWVAGEVAPIVREEQTAGVRWGGRR